MVIIVFKANMSGNVRNIDYSLKGDSKTIDKEGELQVRNDGNEI